VNLEKQITPMNEASFSTNFKLQKDTKLSHNNYPEALALKAPLLVRKLHVNTALYAKREYANLVPYRYKFPLFILLS
jgi:hypothetical protein